MRRIVFGALVSAVAQSASVAQAQSGELLRYGEARTVFITYFNADKDGLTKDLVVGSGVVVSGTGTVLTAYHVVDGWLKQSALQRGENKLMGAIGSSFADKRELLPPERLSSDQGDFAILRFAWPQSGYLWASFCPRGTLDEVPDRKFTAFGFPRGKNIQSVPGTFGNTTGEAGTWSAQSGFDRGMSGGPVFDSLGSLIGIIRSSVAGSNAVQHVTPIFRMTSGLLDMNVQANCASPLGLTQPSGFSNAPAPSGQKLPANCNEVVFTDHTKMPPSTTKEVICR